jgi:hypothetical protein
MHWVDWDSLFAFVRTRYPLPSKYGTDKGGRPEAILKILRNDAELERISKALFDIEIEYKASTSKHYDAIEAAEKHKESRWAALLETLPKDPRG